MSIESERERGRQMAIKAKAIPCFKPDWEAVRAQGADFSFGFNHEFNAPLKCDHAYVLGHRGFTCVSCGDTKSVLLGTDNLYDTNGDF
jgi:hypothetical protein